jgi:post-segregation antitoxin (ccd killing protein)
VLTRSGRLERYAGSSRATDTPEEATTLINIYVSSRSLAAARNVDPNVSPAAVRAAVEVAIAEHMRQQGRRPEELAEESPGPEA